VSEKKSVVARFAQILRLAAGSLTNWPAGGLEEAKHEVDGPDEEVAELLGKANKVEPKANIDEEEAGTASEQANGQDGGRVEGVAELAADDVADGVGGHEGRVHGGKDEGGVSGLILQLLLDGRVALAGEVGHEIATECDEEGPPATTSWCK
jgi:hypothetical protein